MSHWQIYGVLTICSYSICLDKDIKRRKETKIFSMRGTNEAFMVQCYSYMLCFELLTTAYRKKTRERWPQPITTGQSNKACNARPGNGELTKPIAAMCKILPTHKRKPFWANYCKKHPICSKFRYFPSKKEYWWVGNWKKKLVQRKSNCWGSTSTSIDILGK